MVGDGDEEGWSGPKLLDDMSANYVYLLGLQNIRIITLEFRTLESTSEVRLETPTVYNRYAKGRKGEHLR